MDTGAVQHELHARVDALQASLCDRWGEVPFGERTLVEPRYDPPSDPEDIFPWVSVCLVRAEDYVLYIRTAAHEQHVWEPPGGCGREGETPAGTAVREVREETGIECQVTDLLRIETLEFEYGSEGRFPVAQPVFEGWKTGGRAGAREDHITGVQWFDVEDPPPGLQYRDVVAEAFDPDDATRGT